MMRKHEFSEKSLKIQNLNLFLKKTKRTYYKTFNDQPLNNSYLTTVFLIFI